MDKKRRIISIIAGLLAVIMTIGLFVGVLPSIAGAEEQKSSSELKKEIDQLKDEKKKLKEEIDGLENQVSDNLSDIESILEQKSIIEQEITLLFQQIENINEQITTYGTLIAEKQRELGQAQAEYRALNEKNKERIRAMEENGKISYWSVLFKAQNFSDLLDRLNMIEEIAAADQRRLEEMDRAAKAVEQAKEELLAEKSALETSREELEATREEVNAKQAEADKLLKKLLATGVEYQNLLDEAEAKEGTLRQELDDLEDDYKDAKQREYEEWLAAHPPKPPTPPTPPYGGGGGSAGTGHVVEGVTWLVPINYTKVSSPFGYRIHPITGKWKLHAGVDLAAPQGTPIYASRSGVVSYAGYEAGGAGNFVNIDHKDGYVTRYMHMTHYIVSRGQYVSAGQVIGYCGSTGASTGPHLHFGVYHNGTAINPAPFINL